MSISRDTGAYEQVVRLKGEVSLDVGWDVCLLGFSVPKSVVILLAAINIVFQFVLI